MSLLVFLNTCTKWIYFMEHSTNMSWLKSAIKSDKMLEKMPENFERLFLYQEEENKILIGID